MHWLYRLFYSDFSSSNFYISICKPETCDFSTFTSFFSFSFFYLSILAKIFRSRSIYKVSMNIFILSSSSWGCFFGLSLNRQTVGPKESWSLWSLPFEEELKHFLMGVLYVNLEVSYMFMMYNLLRWWNDDILLKCSSII